MEDFETMNCLKPRHLSRPLSTLASLLFATSAWTQTLEMKPATAPREIRAGARTIPAWQTTAEEPSLVFKSPSSPSLATGECHVAIPYLDKGYGRVQVEFKNANGEWKRAEKFTQVMMLDSGEWKTSFQKWPGKPSSPPELRIRRERSEDPVLILTTIALQREPFTDAHFKYILDEPWKRPYAGPTAKGVDNRTLAGKVMTGYQGWFRTPNDPYDQGWVHWGNIANGHFNIDMWPETSMYPKRTLDKACDVVLKSGKPAYLFSSAWPDVAIGHFGWMREHDIDGAFLQRFLTDGSYATTGRPEWVLGNVREAANRQGRIWAIEYDISGTKDEELLDKIQKDWKWLIDEFGLREDPAYARENGKPVVFVWGMAVQNRGIKPETADAVIDFLKNDPKYGGNHVIGGLPGSWRDLEPAWQEHIKKHDEVLAWMSQRYEDDQKEFTEMGVKYWPHVWPGFSWANLKHLPSDSTNAYTPRDRGNFFRGLLERSAASGADRLFVGMFDEYDEATAIMPMSDDSPPTPSRPGLIAKFYSGEDREFFRTEHLPQIDLPLGGQPPTRDIPADNFTVYFEGEIVSPGNGSYTFAVSGPSGDSAELTLGKEKREFPDVSNPGEGLKIPMTTGEKLVYRLEYTHREGRGRVQLLWDGPGATRGLVPASAFLDRWGRFITNEGDSPDLYMKLSGEWKKSIKTK